MRKKIIQSLSAFLVIAFLATPFYFVSIPQKVDAEAGCLIAYVGGWIAGLLGLKAAAEAGDKVNPALAVPVNDVATHLHQEVQDTAQITLTFKACILDPLAWLAAKLLLQAITASIVQWINSGFQGYPTFVTDPSGFLLDVGDRVAGTFITEGGLEFLCSPFKLEVQIALLLRYFSPYNKTYCRLSDISTNINNFINGTFADGGWPAWFEMSIGANGGGNVYGSYLDAASRMDFLIKDARGREVWGLNLSGGFFGQRDANGNIQTPGRYIAHELDIWTDNPEMSLVAADEMDEILSALMSYLVQNLLTGPGGLLGASQPQADGRPSYLAQLGDDALNQEIAAFNKQRQELLDQVNQTLAQEQVNGHNEFIADLTALRDKITGIATGDTNKYTLLQQYGQEYTSIKTQIDNRDAGNGNILPPPPPGGAPGTPGDNGTGGGGGTEPPPPPPPPAIQ